MRGGPRDAAAEVGIDDASQREYAGQGADELEGLFAGQAEDIGHLRHQEERRGEPEQTANASDLH